MIYIIGSLANPLVPFVAEELRRGGHEVFDEWYSAGEFADQAWQEHCRYRGLNYQQALDTPHAENVFTFDLTYLLQADAVVLVMPAGKSAHLELGWALGKGKPGYILLDGEPDRFDVMHLFADGVFNNPDELMEELKWLL